jgi:hypothetical protein
VTESRLCGVFNEQRLNSETKVAGAVKGVFAHYKEVSEKE